MATIKRWTSTDGDYNNAASWVPSGKPVAGEIGLADGSSQKDFLTNLDQTAVVPLKFITGRKYRGDVGASGNPLIISHSTPAGAGEQIRHSGSGDFHLRIANAFWNQIRQDGPGRLYIDSVTTDQTIGGMYVLGGEARLIGNSDVEGWIYVNGVGALLVVEDGPGDVGETIICKRGEIQIDRAISAATKKLVIEAGTVKCTKDISIGDLGTGGIFIGERGKLVWTPDAAPVGTPGVICDGVLDARDSQYPLVFTDLVKGPNAQVLGDVSQAPHGWEPAGVSLDLNSDET